MRVLNDKDEKRESSPVGFLPLMSHSLFSSLGIATVILGPLPMIFAHFQFPDPWPKLTALFGAIFALTLLEVPVVLVAVTFVFGLFVADSVWKGSRFWKLIIHASLLALILGISVTTVLAHSKGLGILIYWKNIVTEALEQMHKTLQVDKAVQWDVIRTMILYEGPFFILSGAILSVWFSVGIAAHLQWLPSEHALSGRSLRQLRLPAWLSVGFLVLFLGSFSGIVRVRHLSGGIFRVISSLMFIQGCVCFSEFLSHKMLSQRTRTLIYSVTVTAAVILGFYPLTTIGAISPWIFRRKEPV